VSPDTETQTPVWTLQDPTLLAQTELVLVYLLAVCNQRRYRGKPAVCIKAWPYSQLTPEQDAWLEADEAHGQWFYDDFQEDFWPEAREAAEDLGLSYPLSSDGNQGGWLCYGRDRDDFSGAHNDLAYYAQKLRRAVAGELDLDEILENEASAWEAELVTMLAHHRDVCEEATAWLQLEETFVKPYLKGVPAYAVDIVTRLMAWDAETNPPGILETA
jgi:hypothetical protein